MPDQPKTPLKVGQSGCNFHRKLSLYQRMILYRAGPLEGNLKNFNFRGGGGPCHPSGGRFQVYYNIVNLKPKLNFFHILIINEMDFSSVLIQKFTWLGCRITSGIPVVS